MKSLFRALGIDLAIFYTLIFRLWSLLAGSITIVMVLRFLTPVEQGFYYTFASVIAAQIFFELGLSVVVQQFASHEMAGLTWSDAGTLIGSPHGKSRLRSLLILVGRWYAVVVVFIFIVILPAGWIFFSINNSGANLEWGIPWTLLVVAAGINIFLMPFLSILEGCGCIHSIARLRMIQGLIGSLLAWIILIMGGGLYALPAMNLVLAFTTIAWAFRTKKIFFLDLYRTSSIAGGVIKWRSEIWPFQWRIGLSWLSGYFIFQLFVPVLFAYKGALEAGRMGVSISIANALMSLAMAWMNVRATKFGMYVANGNYKELDRVFKHTFICSFGLMLLIGSALCVINYYGHVKSIPKFDRILAPLPFFLLICANLFAYITYAEATYLRAHKEEPFMFLSITIATLISLLTLFTAKEYGSDGLMFSYALVYAFVGVGFGSIIFFLKKAEWQKNVSSLS